MGVDISQRTILFPQLIWCLTDKNCGGPELCMKIVSTCSEEQGGGEIIMKSMNIANFLIYPFSTLK